jgi:hypothetical protein
MKRRKPKDKPLKVALEYEPTPDGEERLKRIAELLLSKQNEDQKSIAREDIVVNREWHK